MALLKNTIIDGDLFVNNTINSSILNTNQLILNNKNITLLSGDINTDSDSLVNASQVISYIQNHQAQYTLTCDVVSKSDSNIQIPNSPYIDLNSTPYAITISNNVSDATTRFNFNVTQSGWIDGGTKSQEFTLAADYAMPQTIYIKAGSSTISGTVSASGGNYSVSSGGLVSGTISGSATLTPTVASGWVETGTGGTVSASGSISYQLPLASITANADPIGMTQVSTNTGVGYTAYYQVTKSGYVAAGSWIKGNTEYVAKATIVGNTTLDFNESTRINSGYLSDPVVISASNKIFGWTVTEEKNGDLIFNPPV